jgi:hypothetical protein
MTLYHFKNLAPPDLETGYVSRGGELVVEGDRELARPK